MPKARVPVRDRAARAVFADGITHLVLFVPLPPALDQRVLPRAAAVEHLGLAVPDRVLGRYDLETPNQRGQTVGQTVRFGGSAPGGGHLPEKRLRIVSERPR